MVVDFVQLIVVDFTQFILDNWEIIEANWGLFTVFGVFCILITLGVHKWIYDHILYRDLPEKRELDARIQKLTSENESLKEENRRLQTDQCFMKGTAAVSGTQNIGEKIADALQK